MNTMVKDPGAAAGNLTPSAIHGPKKPKNAFDTQTARVAYIVVDRAGELKSRFPGDSWILLVKQRPGEVFPQIGGGTYREEAFLKSPGGGLEPGETVEEAAVRELEQETGISLPAAALDAKFSMEFEAASRRLDFKVPVGENIAHWNTFFLYVTAKVPTLPLKPVDSKEIEKAFFFRIKDIHVLKREGLFGSELAPSHRSKLAALFRQRSCLQLLRFAGVDETDIRIMQRLHK